MKQYFVLLLLVLLPVLVLSQQSAEGWIATEATIIEIKNKRRAKNTRAFAIVTYTANDGKEYKSQVEVLAIPIIGTTKSVNDKITVLYDPAKPMLAKSTTSSFIETYGLYILIAAGVILSFFNLKKMWSKKSETK